MARAALTASLFVLCTLSAPACSKDEACEGAACTDASAMLPPTGDGGAAGFNDGFTDGLTEDEACAMQVARARLGPSKPLDVIFVIDNSASMEDEITAVRDNINAGFAALIEASGADFRVIMLSRFGVLGTNVCIEPPLAGAECSAGLGLAATNGGKFFHYDVNIDSLNPLCKLLERFDEPDESGRTPGGWQEYLRPEAHKAFVLITDDSASCAYEDDDVSVSFGEDGVDPFEDALMFHSALLAKAPEQFGVPPDVRYQFYSFVGLQPSEPESAPYFPHEDLVDLRCDTAASVGLAYQALSVITDSLRYPVCEGRGFDAVFRVLAQNVVESIKAECTFEIPAAPVGQQIDVTTITMRYQSAGQGEAALFEQVASDDACNDHAFYILENRLELCPQACAVVQADTGAEIEVLYDCLTRVQ
jgi:hypothetical protein